MIQGMWKLVNSRRLRLNSCKKYGCRCAKDSEGKRLLVFDYHDRKGNISAQHVYHLDHFDKKFTWEGDPRSTRLYGMNLWEGSGSKRLVITKGEIDTITIAQAFNLKWQVVGVPGYKKGLWMVKENYEWVNSFNDIVLAFDNSEAGLQSAEEIASLFSPGKVRIMEYDGFKDANHMLQENAGDRIALQVFNAKAFRPDGIVFGDELWEDLITDPPTGFLIPYPILSEKLKGFRKGRIFLFTAGSGLGKSTLAHEIAYNLLIEHKQKVGVMALEEPRKRLGERYLAIKLNRQIHVDREGLTEADLRCAFDATINNKDFCLYDHMGSKDIKTLLSKVRYMVVGLGMEWVVLDHISIVVSGTEEISESERKTIDRLMTELATMVEELDFGLLAIVHLKRKDKGKAYNEGRQVSLSDLRGSGSLEQLSHVVVSMERNQQDESVKHYSQLRILKDRDIGNTGLADVLLYDPDTGRLKASEDNPFENMNNNDGERGDF
jgi:twinkle protein